MKGTITSLGVVDVRFPTSRDLDGSDAMNVDPDYSAAYVILGTDRGDGVEGHGLTFTIGRGTEVVVSGINAIRPLLLGQPLAAFTESPGAFYKRLTNSDSQLRWLGPEKGVMQLATAAVVNALWDLWAKLASQPLWKLLADMSPAQIVELVDWRYLSDALTPEEARRALDRLVPTRAAREAELRERGYPAYTTSVGWLGYADDKIRRLCREALAIKVGANRADDIRRAALVRQEIGPDGALMIDANQRWDVGEAIDWVRALAPSRPLWIEAPTTCWATPPSPVRSSHWGSAWPPARWSRVAWSGSSSWPRAPSRSVSSISAACPASTRWWRRCSSPRASGFPSARTPAAWGCANTCSTPRSSTTSPSAARWPTAPSSTSTTCTSTSSIPA
jgi:L-alanine-DL-glutamate epimerase-like enolase superfamily enzyme